jgi:hypothetical protein
MNKMLWLINLSGFALLTASCANPDPSETPTSTPVDSTNVHGTAPANYDDAADTAQPMLPNEPTEGHRANTPDGDSVPSTRK